MKKQLNNFGYIRVCASGIAHATGNGTAMETIAIRLERMQTKAVGHGRYVNECIAHARTIADTLADTAENRANIYADMEMLELFIIGLL